MDSSTHKAEVVEVKLRKHEQSNHLSIVDVYGYTVVVKTEDWQGRTKGIYICPDSIVPTNKAGFAFLKREGRDVERIKVKRLRGVLSMGLLIPCPDDAEIGEDFAERLGVTRYEPELKLEYEIGEDEHSPSLFVPKYHLDTIYRYNHLLKVGEPLFVQEKINGQNMRVVYTEQKMYCGSRIRWKKEYSESAWWKTYYNTPSIEKFCKEHPDYILFGESYGNVGGFQYNVDKLSFAAFDILHNGKWLNTHDFLFLCKLFEIPIAPVLAIDFLFDFDKIKEMANGPSTIENAGHCREGVVVRPMIERSDPHLGRVILKVVGEDYYNRKGSK